jgi:exosortase A-associated hydrolase 2
MLRAEILQGRCGRLLAVVHSPPAAAPRRAVVVVPSFAEEMNKSRRMVTLFANAAQLRGIETVVPDLTGTGDSDGEFRDARWDIWCDDLQRTMAAVAARTGLRPALLAVRSGALLAFATLAQRSVPCSEMLLWAPVLDGERFMRQFLRLRVAASVGRETRESVTEMETALRNGTELEVGGYQLAPQLWAAMSACRSAQYSPPGGATLHWFELVAAEPAGLSPASGRSVAELERCGWRVHAHALTGAAFWGTAEIAEVPELVTASVAALEQQR